jgi:hypothetical protein
MPFIARMKSFAFVIGFALFRVLLGFWEAALNNAASHYTAFTHGTSQVVKNLVHIPEFRRI